MDFSLNELKEDRKQENSMNSKENRQFFSFFDSCTGPPSIGFPTPAIILRFGPKPFS